MRNRQPSLEQSERPPWWPEGESWPPERGPWQGMRQRFMRRIGLLLAALFAALFGAMVLGFLLFGGRHEPNEQEWQGWDGPPIFGILILLGAAFLVFRLLRRTAAPASELMEATGRLAAGDYAVRVHPGGSSETRDLALAFN